MTCVAFQVIKGRPVYVGQQRKRRDARHLAKMRRPAFPPTGSDLYYAIMYRELARLDRARARLAG